MNYSKISPKNIRKIILQQSQRAHVGHIGSALSIADILAVLYSHINVPTPAEPLRDRFILSKGHAALALYAVFFLKGWISEAQLDTYCMDNSLLAVHPEHELPGVEFSTGSLGMGLSFGIGLALGARLKKESCKTFVLMSDAECNEGAVWEAVMLAGHQRLSNLVAIIDANGQQAFGYTKDVLNLKPLGEKFRQFGWAVHSVDGHDVTQLEDVICHMSFNQGLPQVIVADTIFGKGVSYMQNQIKWHYWPMSEKEYQAAVVEIDSSP
jgi:transketolase